MAIKTKKRYKGACVKRDFAVIKKIILHAKMTNCSFTGVPDVSDNELFDNAELLCDAGLIKISYFNDSMVIVQRLTWRGHDAADFLLSDENDKEIDWNEFIR